MKTSFEFLFLFYLFFVSWVFFLVQKRRKKKLFDEKCVDRSKFRRRPLAPHPSFTERRKLRKNSKKKEGVKGEGKQWNWKEKKGENQNANRLANPLCGSKGLSSGRKFWGNIIIIIIKMYHNY